MIAVRVFDPAMCCSTGICGPSVDPQLARFAADLDWLKSQGVSVERFNLSQQPAAFADDASVKHALETKGEAGLPLIKVNGEVKSVGTYPTRDELSAWAGLGTAIASNGCCGPAKTETCVPQEAASACCAPGSQSESSAPKKSGCC
jgi:hypothetical protein